MYSLKRVLFAVFAFISVNAYSQDFNCRIHDHKSIPRERFVDFERAIIDISIEPHVKKVSGSVTLDFKPLRLKLDSLWLDGPNIEFHSVHCDGDSLEFKEEKKGVWIYFKQPLKRGEKHRLSVFYDAIPKKGMYFTGWSDTTNQAPKQVWTQGQGIDNRHWFPHFDDLGDKLYTETIITFDTGFSILSNGELISDEIIRDKQRVHYAMPKPHSSYLVMIAIGDYGVSEVQSSSGTPIRNWYYNNAPEKVEPTYRGTSDLMGFLEEYTGVSYPWGSYAQVPVHDFLYGAMENTSATIFSDKFYVDSIEYSTNNYVYVNAHEMAHQWFGNLITSRSSEAHWIHEGFATYFHTLWQGEFLGEEEGIVLAESNRQVALKAGLVDNYPITDSRAGSARHYMKAATVLRMLKDEVGEELFKETLTHFLTKYAYQSVSSEDLLRSFNDVTGQSFDTFFEQWVFTGQEPKISLEVLEEFQGNQGTYLKFVLDSNSVQLPFELRVPIAVKKKNAFRECIYRIKGDTVILVDDNNPQKIEWVEVDANRHLLVDWSWKNRPIAWLKLLAVEGSSIFARKDAIQDLAKYGELTSKHIKVLLASEKSDYVRADIVSRGAINISANLARELLRDPHKTRTRLAALQEFYEIVQNDTSLILNIIESGDNEIIKLLLFTLAEAPGIPDAIVEALHQRAMQYPEVMIYFNRFEIYQGRKNEGIEGLILLTNESIDFNTRIEAFSILASLDIKDVIFYSNLKQALTSFNSRLRNGAKKAFKKLDKDSVVEYLEHQEERELLQFYSSY